jgi:hypothetical protein
MIDLNVLIEWLGTEGSRSGLKDSDIPLKDLIDVAKRCGLILPPKPTRDDVANELAYRGVKKIEKSLDELMTMLPSDLLEYLEKRKPTVAELLGILDELGIKAGSEDRKHLIRFAAREISDTGMFQRVARGAAANGKKSPRV